MFAAAKRSAGRPARAAPRLHVSTVMASVAICVASAGISYGQPREPLDIQPLTRVSGAGEGYLADPQPIRLAPSRGGRVQMISGTTRAVISCSYPIRAGCFTWTPVAVNAGSLQPEIAASGAAITNFQNLDIFQDDAGEWHAAVTIGVKSPGHPDHWTVIVHAHPNGSGSSTLPPLSWSADTVLAGSFAKPVEGNYDGKYFEDNGRLYLLYVRNDAPKPALRNSIVIQPLKSPTQLADVASTTLLTPGDRDGGLASEWYGRTQAKLVEAPYVSRIGGKYALVYSTGAYLTPGYKAAVAWSDTLLPPPGRRYRKVLQTDSLGVWGPPGRREVRYLIQSQDQRWPNFTGDRVIAPGVAAAVQGPAGGWWLYFNGFAPGDMPTGPGGRTDGGHRRPFVLALRATPSDDRSVEDVSDAELAAWLTPKSIGEAVGARPGQGSQAAIRGDR